MKILSRRSASNCIIIFTILQALSNISKASDDSTTASSPRKETQGDLLNDPNAWEGSCVVVCDASPVQSPQQAPSISRSSQQRPLKKLAFSAMKSDDTANLNTGKNPLTILFNFVVLNKGNCFHMMESKFTASANGVYSFDFTIFKLYNSNSLTVALTVNRNPLFTAIADGNLQNHEMARNAGLVQLKIGDEVRVEILKGNLEGGWQYSTFSGYLLFEDSY